jgi:hypothetical protein
VRDQATKRRGSVNINCENGALSGERSSSRLRQSFTACLLFLCNVIQATRKTKHELTRLSSLLVWAPLPPGPLQRG